MSKAKPKKTAKKKQQQAHSAWASLPGYGDYQQPYVWQKSQWDALRGRAAQRRLPQAWLFTGPEGIGKRLLTAWWMQWLQCEDVRRAQHTLFNSELGGQSQVIDQEGESHQLPDAPCGLCAGCTQVRAQTHADCLWVSPELQGGQIKIDQIREVIHFMHQTAKQGGARVVIIEPVEAMNDAAQNALLKTLEEPGDGAQFILISHSAQGVLPTITSRCQRLPFGLPDAEQVMSWLNTLPVGALPEGITPEQAIEALPAVSGAPLSLLAFLRDDWFAGRQALTQSLLALSNQQQSFAQVAASGQEWPLVARIALVIQLFQQKIKQHMVSDNTAVAGTLDPDAKNDNLLFAFDTYRQLLSLYQLARSANSVNEVLLWEKVLMAWQAV